MLAAARDGNAVQNNGKIDVELIQQIFRLALFGRLFAPCVEHPLRVAENRLHISAEFKFFAHFGIVAAISEQELVFQVVVAVIDGRCRKHQNFCFDAVLHDALHQKVVTGIAVAPHRVVVAEIVAFVDDDQIVIAPIYRGKIHIAASARRPAEIGMEENVKTDTVFIKNVRRLIALILCPILLQPFRTQNKNRLIAKRIILHHRKRRKCFTEPHAVRQNATVVAFQLIDNAHRTVFLEIVQFIPDDAVFETRRLVGHIIFVEVVQKLTENVIQNDKVNKFGRVFFIARRYVVHDGVCNVFEFFSIVPQAVKLVDKKFTLFGDVCLHNADEVAVVAFVT